MITFMIFFIKVVSLVEPASLFKNSVKLLMYVGNLDRVASRSFWKTETDYITNCICIETTYNNLRRELIKRFERPKG